MVADAITLTILGWLHLLSVIFWIGGSLFIETVLQPVLKSSNLSPEQIGIVNKSIAKRFSPMVWFSIAVLLVTGLMRANMVNVLSFDVLTSSTYGLTLLSKMLLFLVAIIIGIGISSIGVKLGRVKSQQEALGLFGKLSLLARVNIVLAFLIILLAVSLQYGL